MNRDMTDAIVDRMYQYVMRHVPGDAAKEVMEEYLFTKDVIRALDALDEEKDYTETMIAITGYRLRWK